MYCYISASACTFPAAFQNTWVTSNRGTWTVGTNTISNFRMFLSAGGIASTYTMDCFSEYNGYYIIKYVGA